MVKTHKDYLVENHGLAAQHNPPVYCACGRTTSADMCVDLTVLPMKIRKALGLEKVDFLCDACQARLVVNRHVAEDEFYALLGQDDEGALFEHNARDAEHQRGVEHRHPAHKPRHERVSEGKVKDFRDADDVPVMAAIPLQEREVSHARQAQWLAYRYDLTNVEQPPDRRELEFDAIDLDTGEKVRGRPIEVEQQEVEADAI
jgi:hypothetical protein